MAALEEIRRVLPFVLRGIDSDNGSEFINDRLDRYYHKRRIPFTRRLYQKNNTSNTLPGCAAQLSHPKPTLKTGV